MALALPTPDAFPAFPYDPPYPIQRDLMRHLYAAVEARRVAIVESPTGTGKTLSLLCAALTWLRDDRDRARSGLLAADPGDAPDWVAEQTRARHSRELEAADREYAARLARARAKERMARARVTKRRRAAPAPAPDADAAPDDDAFLPDDAPADDDNISPAVRALMARVDARAAGPPAPEPTCTKVFYASRTHSQLAQVLPELRRLRLARVPDAATAAPGGKRAHEDEEDAPAAYSRAVALGARRHLCINDRLRAAQRDLDEGCRELLGESGERRCPYLPPPDEDARMADFRDQILASPKDIEDLAAAGRAAETCPYFGSRRAIPQAELVTLPYNLLLSKTAREALGIDLTGHVVVIDEAHNLVPTLLALSAVRLPAATLRTARAQVARYLARFRTRLAAAHALHLARLAVFLDALQRYASEWAAPAPAPEPVRPAPAPAPAERSEVLTVTELLRRLGRKVVGINLLEVEAYLRSSKIARKISGYAEKVAETGEEVRMRKGQTPPLHAVEAFMVALSGSSDDGRITLTVHSANPEQFEIKYQQLNPAPHFAEVVSASRSVILAGGTMSPMADVVNQLFADVPPARLSTFSCGHIVPPTSLQALVVGRGPRGGRLEYKAAQQSNAEVIAELGQILQNLAHVVPAGLVVFFPSYGFLHRARAAWETGGVLARLGAKKRVFFEPEGADSVEQTLAEYARAIRAPPAGRAAGALLLAVVGAKLSEGLNFADALARAVVVVGMPYANRGSAELQERLKYVRAHAPAAAGARDAAAELYENMCMHAVNQSIGRAIRHRGDWAALVLLDARYAAAGVQKKLPAWIEQSISAPESFGQAMRELGTFFRGKKDGAAAGAGHI